MPNHIHNEITLPKGHEDKILRTEDGEQFVDFNLVIECPPIITTESAPAICEHWAQIALGMCDYNGDSIEGDGLVAITKKIRVKLAAGDKKVIATRTMTEANSSITLMDENGDKISAQDFKRMISDLSVNPHRITSMKKAEQLECLIRSANLGDYDLKSADRQIAIETERRLELGRSMRATDPGEEPEKADKVDVTELMQQRDAVNEWNSLDERMDTKIEDLQTHLEKKIEAKKAYNEKIERQINELPSGQSKASISRKATSSIKIACLRTWAKANKCWSPRHWPLKTSWPMTSMWCAWTALKACQKTTSTRLRSCSTIKAYRY